MAIACRKFEPSDLETVLDLCRQEGWPSFVNDPPRALRALTAPGVTTIVASVESRIVGFAQLLSDGEIQAHLSLIAVHKAFRRRGIARTLIEHALLEAGGERIDLVTDTAPEFYSALPHRRMHGFRLYPG